jgi:PKD repeat protein/methionine-rich copper-binding protein CopC
MWPLSSPSKLAIRVLKVERLSRRSRRRFRTYLRLETLEDRQLLSGPTATFIKADTATQGNWIGTYGSQGYDVIGNAASLPSYATATPAGQSSATWAASSSDPRALQDASGSGRVAACWYSASSFSINVNLTDGQTHDLELYFVDWDTTARSEQVRFSSGSSGAQLNTLSTETVTSFHSGVYLDWAISGNLVITVTQLAGINAVLSGLFLDPPSTGTPKVSFESPAPGASNVAVSSSVNATFNEAVQPGTVSFTLTNSAGTAVPASLTYNSSTNTATLTPSPALAYGTKYVATVSRAEDTAGDPMAAPVSWSFTTDKVQPAVASHTPLSGATGVAVSSPLTATFNEAVQASTINFTLTNSAGTAVPASLAYNSSTDTATLTPSAALAYGTTYVATVSGARDTAGDPMAGSVTWSFTTDKVQPAVASHTPVSGATGVAVSSPITATFNEAVQASTINFTLTNTAGTAVPASLTYNSSTDTATLTPSAALAYGMTYTATVSGARDTAGDPMAAPVSWSFITPFSTSSALIVSAGSSVSTNAGSNAKFAGAVSGGTPPYSYSWNFGDGTTSAGNSAQFTSTNTTTQGNWTGVYGAAGYNVIGSTSSYPSYATVTPSGQSSYIWDATTSDARGLLTPGSTSRIAGCWYSYTSFTIGVNLTDGQMHPVSLYAVDWDWTSRSEQIQALNGSTGAVLDTRTISGFHGGEYLTWDVSGYVKFKVTLLDGVNAVVSGLFIGAGLTPGANTLTPSHVYANPGTYTATLTARDSAGHSGTSSTTVTVHDVAPTVTLSDAPATVGVPVNFSATATDISPAVQAAGFTYNWNFGDGTTGTGASPSHTFSAAGKYTVSVTATDEYGNTSIPATASLVVKKASNSDPTIDITSTWLQQNGPAPYLLDQPNTTYVLQTNVTTSGTAFVIANQYVTLNLNGHTITYNNAAPLTIPNGNFGADPIGSTNVTGWNLSGAPNSQFTVAADNEYLYSPQVLNWTVPSGTTPQVIQTSTAIPIPVANQTYTASVAESPLGNIGECSLEIQVIDSVTGQLVTNWRRIDAGNTDQANCPSFSFMPTTTDPVYISITMTPSQSTGASVVIDRVVLTRSMDYGILASSGGEFVLGMGTGWTPTAYGGTGQANGYLNLPASIRAVCQNVYAPTILGPGSIVQGQAAGAYCHNIVLDETGGPVIVNGVTTYTDGDDTTAIHAYNSDSSLTDTTDSRTIENCTVNYARSGPIVTIRAADIPAIDVSGFSPALVQGCTITNNPQVGIRAAGAGPGIYQTIQDNTLTPNVNITNGYALSLGGNDINCLNNTVYTSTTGSTRGIAVGDGSISNIDIAGNTIIVRENPNREYGDSGTTARALEIRCYAPNTLTNINITNNYFEAITGVGLMQGATAVRLIVIPTGSTGISFTNDAFKAICIGTTDPGPAYYAHALEVDDVEVGSSDPVVFNGCWFESDDTAIALGGTAYINPKTNNVSFIDSNIILATTPGAVKRTFVSYYFGDQNFTLSGIQVIGSTYQNGAPSTIDFVGSGQKSVTVGWVLTTQVEDTNGNPLVGALVDLWNANGTLVGTGTTDSNGDLVLDVGTIQYSGTTNPTAASVAPISMTVSKSGHAAVSRSLSLTANQTITVTL